MTSGKRYIVSWMFHICTLWSGIYVVDYTLGTFFQLEDNLFCVGP